MYVLAFMEVSNPNGVNLHITLPSVYVSVSKVSNPNGVNLHVRVLLDDKRSSRSFKPQRGKFTLLDTPRINARIRVSNPNGVNLHNVYCAISFGY